MLNEFHLGTMKFMIITALDVIKDYIQCSDSHEPMVPRPKRDVLGSELVRDLRILPVRAIIFFRLPVSHFKALCRFAITSKSYSHMSAFLSSIYTSVGAFLFLVGGLSFRFSCHLHIILHINLR